jgi:PD-(D/E)XK nuclease superfamily
LIEEKKFNAVLPILVEGTNHSVMISGRIDRVDSKNSRVRVIDYKTGKDDLTFESIASLFGREGKRNKAAFQTILYSWLYRENAATDNPISPMLMNRKSLFKEGLKVFKMNKEEIQDVRPWLTEFEERLNGLLKELYNPEILFTQTTEVSHCKFCLFKSMCRR